MEFAVVAPIFITLMLGMIELGRAFMVQQVITNASREGARVAVLDGSSATDVGDTIERYLHSGGIEGANITIDPSDPQQAGFGEPVSVTVDIGFSQVSWLPSPRYFGQNTLSATTVMRRERVQ